MESEYALTTADLAALREGDVLRSISTGHTYVVTQNTGGVVTAVQSITILRPEEWVLVRPTKQAHREEER